MKDLDLRHDLALDRYMADGGRYRRRRHAVFAASGMGAIVRQPHQPHFQTTEYNPLHGGISRWFEPIKDDVSHSASLTTVLALLPFDVWKLHARDQGLANRSAPVQNRSAPGEEGRPTPEGLHRDGVDYVLVLLVNRGNIASGVTRIHALDGAALGQFTLTHPFDAAIVDDRRVAHGVTAVEALELGLLRVPRRSRRHLLRAISASIPQSASSLLSSGIRVRRAHVMHRVERIA